MRKVLAPFVVLTITGGVGFAEECAMTQSPICPAPCQNMQQPESARRPESAPQSQGAYIRGPESGEFEGGATSFGVKGFGFKLPSIAVDGMEFRLPHMTRYRKNPVFHSQSAQAPFVRGPVAQFNQVQPEDQSPESAPNLKPEATPNPTPQPPCVPPAPSCNTTSIELRLRNELDRKDAQLKKMSEQLERLERTVNQFSESQRVSQSTASKARTVSERQILEAAYTEEESSIEEPSPLPPSRPKNIRASSRGLNPSKGTSATRAKAKIDESGAIKSRSRLNRDSSKE